MKVLVSLLAILVFLCTAAGLGAVVLFGLVAFVIGPHGVGLLPEWANLPVLISGAAGVCFVAFKAAMWTQVLMVRKLVRPAE